MFKELNQLYINNPQKFHKEWIEFDLEGKEAKENIWGLLYDYSAYYGNSFLSDKRCTTPDAYSVI